MKHPPLIALAYCLLLPAASDPGIAAGNWTMTFQVIDPAPPATADAEGRRKTTTLCVTPDQARQGLRGILQARGCSFIHFQVHGGTFEARSVCGSENGRMVTTSTGTFTPVSIEMDSAITVSGNISLVTRSRVTGRRVGDC